VFAGTENNGLFVSLDGGNAWKAAAAGQIHNPVNGILLSPAFPRAPHLVVWLGREMLISLDGGETWAGWLQGRLPAGEEITALCAPAGFAPGAPVLLGGMDGIYALTA
jgi:hypothetical protein